MKRIKLVWIQEYVRSMCAFEFLAKIDPKEYFRRVLEDHKLYSTLFTYIYMI